MNRWKNPLRAIGLCFVSALCLMAFSATSAGAQEFTIEGKTLKEHGITKATLAGEIEGNAVFHVPGLGLELSCAEGTATGTISQSGHGEQKLLLDKCTAGPGCEVDPIKAEFLTLVVLHKEEPWLLYTPFNGLTFALITNSGECALPEDSPLKGSFIALVGPNAKEQLLSFANDSGTTALFKELGIKISYAFGAQPAILAISVVLKLSGEHAGKGWGAI